jgi:hypothetical protein
MATVEIRQMNIQEFSLGIIGVSPLICNNPQAAMEALEDTNKSTPRGKRDAEKKFRESLYPMPPDGITEFGFPSAGFKNAFVRAAKQIDGMTMIDTKGDFHIEGSLVPIYGVPELHKSMVRVGRGVADIRYRSVFKEWATEFQIQLDADTISLEQIASLVSRSGFKTGVGDWRPERDGNYGRFRIANADEIDDFKARFGR